MSRGMEYQGYLQIPRILLTSWVNLKQSKTYLCHGVFHNLLVTHVALVTHQQLVDTLGGIAVNFLQPLFDIVEGVHICDIVNDADAVGAAVVRGRNRAKSFLTSSIPLGEPG